MDQNVQEKAVEYVRLGDREREVAKLLAQGLSRKEIARRLGTSDETVKTQISSLIQKFGARNSNHAVALFLDQEMKYGPDGQAHEFFIQHARVGVDIAPNLRDGVFRSDLKLLALRGRGPKMEGSFACDGQIVSVTSFGKPIAASRAERGRVFFRADFPDDVVAGDIVRRNLEITMKDVSDPRHDYWTLEQFMPCARLEFFIAYPKDIVLDFEMIREFGAARTDYPVTEHSQQSRGLFVWTIDAPIIGAFYTIRWTVAAKGG